MRYFFIVILIIMITAMFTVGCGKAPTGETNYKDIKKSIESGESPPTKPPTREERKQQGNETPSNVGGM
jgi:hypothetical protein